MGSVAWVLPHMGTAGKNKWTEIELLEVNETPVRREG